jgi:sn-glycerol 3-phosphate transport system ATP-binding protein
MTGLVLRGISKRFGRETVLAEVSLDVRSGELLVLLGPSGCGKSTLLRIVAGLVAPDEGEVEIAGRRANELEPKERGVALVFQNYALYPHMSVRANLAFPLEVAGLGRTTIAEHVARTAARLGLSELLERKPATLSGGQMQRVALGRALVREPRLFLFDEPLSNLDAKLRLEMRVEIARLVRELGVTTLYVTHDQAEAMTLGTRICVLCRGRVEQLGPPLEVYGRPATSFVAGFVGSPPMNLVRGTIADGSFTAGALHLSAPIASGEALLGIRPHEVELGRGTPLAVESIERLGHETHVRLALGAGATLLAACPPDRMLPECGPLEVELPPRSLHWFDARSGQRLS